MTERAILVSAGGDVQVVREAAFGTEAELQAAVAAHPEVLPAEDVGLDTLVTLGTEVPAAEGFADMLAADRQGRLAIVEFKKGPENPDVRRVVAQLLDYGSALWQTPIEELARLCGVEDVTARAVEDHERLGLDIDPDVFESGLRGTLENGDFVYLYVARVLDRRTRRVLTYLGEGLRLAFVAVEAERFADGALSILAPRPAFVPAWMANDGATRTRPAAPGTTASELLASASPAVQELAARLDELARQRDWRQTEGKASFGYSRAEGPRFHLYPQTGVLYFGLTRYATLTSESDARELLGRLERVAARTLTPKEPGLAAETALAGWGHVRDEILIPFVEAAPLA